jgi:histone-lysine N-methyltransferase SETD3
MQDDRQLLDEMAKSLGEKEDVLGQIEKEGRQVMKGLRDLDRDPNMVINNKFVEWLSTNGVYVKTTSEWGRAPHPLVIASNTEDDGESCGRGLLAREPLNDGELLMTIPLDLCLTRATAQQILGSGIIPDYMDEYIAIAVLLMTERNKGAASKWKPYFDVLPTTQGVYPSFVWTEDELNQLAGSPVYAASMSLKAKVEKEFLETKTRVFDRFPDRFPAEKYNMELFTWAFVMLFSRAARLSSKSGGEELALVPYADLMNHNVYSNTYIDAQRSGMPLISRTEEVALYSDRSYKKFEQVFINYGEKGNADLLLLYGFALERNPFNAVDVAVGLSKEDPLYSAKKRYMDSSGRGATSVRFPLQENRYPSELVDFLRLLLVEPSDLGNQPLDRVDFNEPLSPSLERRVLETIVSVCETYMTRYPTTIDQDEAMMRDRGMYKALSRQNRMAIKLRASEKRILERTIKAVEDELKKLPSIVSADGEVAPAGRSFDALAKKATVINAKSPADWVDLKGMPEDKKADGEDGEKKPASIAERRRKRRAG